MYYKDILEYYNTEKLKEIYKPSGEQPEGGEMKVDSIEEFLKFQSAVYNNLDEKMQSENDDYDKTLQDLYSKSDLKKDKFELKFLSGEEKDEKTALSKEMRKKKKQVTSRELMSGSHMFSVALNFIKNLDYKTLASFENFGLSNIMDSKSAKYLIDGVKFLCDKNNSQKDKLKFINDHIDKIAKFKDDLFKKVDDAKFVGSFEKNMFKSLALEGLGSISKLAEAFGVKLDNATKMRCEYLGKLGASNKENLNANAQRISDVAYATLEKDSAIRLSESLKDNKNISDEKGTDKNTYYSTALNDCQKANFDLMKSFMKESIAEMNINPETTFVDANGKVAKIDDFDKINPTLAPTVVFDANGKLKTFVDFEDISGKPTTYNDVETFDLNNNTKTQKACNKFKEEFDKDENFAKSKDTEIKAIKDNLNLLAGKDYSKINPKELTENTVNLCRDYLKKVRDNPKPTAKETEMAQKIGGMYRSMCCSLGKFEIEKSKVKEWENEYRNSLKESDKENQRIVNDIFDNLEEMPLFEDDEDEVNKENKEENKEEKQEEKEENKEEKKEENKEEIQDNKEENKEKKEEVKEENEVNKENKEKQEENKEQGDIDLAENLELDVKSKDRTKEIKNQEKQRKINDKENDKIVNDIFDDLEDMTFVEDDNGNIDMEMTEKLQDDLAKDTRGINGTFTDKNDKNLSLSVEQQRQMKNKEKEDAYVENDDFSISN